MIHIMKKIVTNTAHTNETTNIVLNIQYKPLSVYRIKNSKIVNDKIKKEIRILLLI